MEFHGVAIFTSVLVFTDQVILGHCTSLIEASDPAEEASWHLNSGLILVAGAASLVLLLMACAKKGQKETSEDIPPTYGDPAMISNASYGASGNEESVGTYASVDPDPYPDSNPNSNTNTNTITNATTNGSMYTEEPEYAQAPVPVSHQTRTSVSRSTGSSVSRDVYGNSDTIFQNVIIRKEEVVLEEVLDSGQFGEVVCGIWNKNDGTQRQIAAKTIKGNISESGRSLFIQEMTTMAQLVHPNVLGVLAVTLEPLMLIMERVSEKSVKSYIEQQGYSHESPIPFPTLLEFVLQTATGMEYLAEHGIVHRDIAARNMLLHVESRTKFTCKVADFGLSKVTFSESFTSKNTDSKIPIPTRWTAMEALFKGRWSSSSDVWSWGVMAWELTTHGQFPYSLVWEDKPTVDYISKGMRLHQAELIPDDLYTILMKCWNVDVAMRPTFGKIVTSLKQLSQKLASSHPDVRRFDVINRKDIEAVLANNSAKTPASMYFFLPTYPRFVVAPHSTPPNKIFLKIMPPEDEDPVFCPKLSPYANELKKAGESFSEHIREKKDGKGELLLIGKDDLLPPGVFFVRQHDKEASRPLYALPDSKRRQSTLERQQNPGSFRSPFRSDDDDIAIDHRPEYDMKAAKPVLRLTNTHDDDDNNNNNMDIDLDDSSSDYTTQQTVWDELEKQHYANVPDQHKYGNMGTNRAMAHAFTLDDRAVVMEWFKLGKVIRQDAEAALKGAGEGAFVVRKKSSAAKDFVITMYLGPTEDVCKHYRLVAEGPEPDFPVSMIDTVNGNMNFPNLWDLLAYYRSHIPGKKRALPIRLGEAVPVPDWI